MLHVRCLMKKMTRREFIAGAVALAGAPTLLRGRNLNDKLDIAFIACGGRALTNLSELTLPAGTNAPAGHPDENVVVLCDRARYVAKACVCSAVETTTASKASGLSKTRRKSTNVLACGNRSDAASRAS